MKCLPLNRDVDICVSVDVKLICKKAADDDLENELRRLDDQARARHLGAGFETLIAQAVVDELCPKD